ATSDSSVVLRDASWRDDDRYLFAKIGSRDAVVYPRILPGSVVRADRCQVPDVHDKAAADERLWLVKHPGGIICCHVRPVDATHVLLLPNRPPLSGWPLCLLREVRILGLVDLELRPRKPGFSPPLCGVARSDRPLTIDRHDGIVNVSTLLRISRARAGLTFRGAHEMTKRIATLLGNREYGIALGLLSDYEAMNRLPRHVAKIMSLCMIYSIDPFELMRAAGVHVDESDKLPLTPVEGSHNLHVAKPTTSFRHASFIV